MSQPVLELISLVSVPREAILNVVTIDERGGHQLLVHAASLPWNAIFRSPSANATFPVRGIDRAVLNFPVIVVADIWRESSLMQSMAGPIA